MAAVDSQVKAVVFDIGATLVTGPPVAPNKVIAGVLEGVTASEVASVIMTTPLASAEEACEVLRARFGTMSPASMEAVSALWHAQTTASSPLEGAAETVLSLKARGFMVGLLSDIWSPYYASVERCLPEVTSAADAIVLSCRIGSRKPSHANFLRVLDDLGLEPRDAVMVGDTYEHDILPALEVGMRAVWVLARPDREARSVISVLNGEAPAPTATVASIADVGALDLLGRLPARSL